MDNNKAWLWRKKSAEKNAVASDKALSENNDEVQTLLTEKAILENDLKKLEATLSSALSENTTKDELVKKQTKMAMETVKGREKAEEEAVSLKLQLDEALQHRRAGEERLSHMDAALKECMQQLRFVREEQERRIHDAVMKTSREFEKSQMMLEEKLSETSKRLSKIVNENAHLGKALVLKEKLIDELNRQFNWVEADFSALKTRLEEMEKDNDSFNYEVRVLEKELEIRNVEREFNRRTAEASHRQHLENVKKIAKLESECQRLRVLVCKRLPGPAAQAKMKNEVEMLGSDSVETRIKLNLASLMTDDMANKSSGTPSKRISMLTEQLFAMKEENKALKEVLNKRSNGQQPSGNFYVCMTSKSSHIESQFDASRKGLMFINPGRDSLMSHELSLAPVSEIGSDDKASCAESWASTLISEVENFRNEKQKGLQLKRGVEASDIDLMDDFVEMEKQAVVSVNKPASGSHVLSNDTIPIAVPLENEYSAEVMSTEIVPLSDSESSFGSLNQGIMPFVNGKFPVWLQDTVKLVLEQNRVTGRSFQEIIEEIKVALDHISCLKPNEHGRAGKSLNRYDVFSASLVNASLSNKSSQQLPPSCSKSIHKMIELIDGLGIPSLDYEDRAKFSGKNSNYSCTYSETPEVYTARVFQWKTSELTAVLQKYVLACYDLLNDKAALDKFVQQLTNALEWIINHCFSLQDVSSMRDAIIKQCDWDDCESEVEVGIMSCFPGMDKPRKQSLHLSFGSASNGHGVSMEDLRLITAEELRISKDELMDGKSSKKELEEGLQLATEISEEQGKKRQEFEKVNETLQTELKSLREEKGIIQDRVEQQKMMNEDLDTQLTVTRQELNEVHQQFASLEVELENKNNCFEELQAMCVELELQLESVKNEGPDSNHGQQRNQLRTDREMSVASEKSAECQETILNLGKQLKALSTLKEDAVLDKVTVASNDAKTIAETIRPTLKEGKSTCHRKSLLDRMLADDDASTKNLKSPETKEIDCNSTTKMGSYGPSLENILVLGRKNEDDDGSDESMAIVTTKKRGGGSFWKKLLWRTKKVNGKQAALSLTS